MPRQPFLPTFFGRPYSIGAQELRLRPAFCEAIGKCIGLWTYVDNEMGDMFNLLLDTKSAGALEVFLSLRRWSNQREALQAAAKFSIPEGEILSAFEALMVIYRGLEAQRNDLAHGCFGIISDDPTLLLWIDVKHHVHFQTEVLLKQKLGELRADWHERLKENLFVYRIDDFDALFRDMDELWWATFWFNGFLREPSNSGRFAEFQKLCASPQIQREISRLNAARENSR